MAALEGVRAVERMKLRGAGCDAVLEKPCSAEDLEAAIRRLVGDAPRTRRV